MAENYLIGVDVGTYSSKGVLVKTDGTLIASHVVSHSMAMPAPGFFEHDADGVPDGVDRLPGQRVGDQELTCFSSNVAFSAFDQSTPGGSGRWLWD